MTTKHGIDISRYQGKPDIVPIDNVCSAHLFKGTAEEREGRRE